MRVRETLSCCTRASRFGGESGVGERLAADVVIPDLAMLRPERVSSSRNRISGLRIPIAVEAEAEERQIA